MTRTAIIAALLGLMLVPAALAQDADETPGRPDDAAWVEDCPPDMMCAAGGVEETNESADKDAPTYDGTCDGEVCMYKDEQPRDFGPEGCIDCMAPAPAETAADADAENKVPAPAVALSLAALGLAAVLLVARRR